MFRSFMTAVLAASMLATGAAAAEVPRTDAEKEAWAKANLETEGWILTGFGGGFVTFAKDQEISGGLLDITLRTEYFAPSADRPFASALTVIELDCGRRRRRAVRVAFYPRNDLKGEPEGDAVHNPWAPFPDDGQGAYYDDVCAAATAPPDPVEGPAGRTEAEVRAWIARTIKAPGLRMAYYDDEGVGFIRGAASRTAEGYRAAGIYEMFEPDEDGRRAVTMQLDLDCEGRRMRITNWRGHERHDPTSQGLRATEDVDWFAPRSGSEALQFDGMCAAAKESLP